MLSRLALSIVCLALFARPAHAVLLAYEDFNYSHVGGDLTGSSGGGSFGFSGPWQGQTSYNVGNGSLSPVNAPLPRLGNSVSAVAFGENRDSHRLLSSSLGADNTSLYVSVMIQPQGILGQGAYNGWFGLALRGGREVYVSRGSFSNNYQLEVGGTSHMTSRSAAVGRTEFFVLRIDFTEGVDSVYLYVNPYPGAPEPMPTVSEINLDVGYVNQVSLTGPGGVGYDAIRIGTTFWDVAPPVSDFNADGTVDAQDLIAWHSNYGSAAANGDADGDGDVDGSDFLIWQRQVGAVYDRPTPSTAIPEPRALVLAAALLGLMTSSQAAKKRLRHSH
jgi:hypothetical protein